MKIEIKLNTIEDIKYIIPIKVKSEMLSKTQEKNVKSLTKKSFN